MKAVPCLLFLCCVHVTDWLTYQRINLNFYDLSLQWNPFCQWLKRTIHTHTLVDFVIYANFIHISQRTSIHSPFTIPIAVCWIRFSYDNCCVSCLRWEQTKNSVADWNGRWIYVNSVILWFLFTYQEKKTSCSKRQKLFTFILLGYTSINCSLLFDCGKVFWKGGTSFKNYLAVCGSI